MSNLTPIENSLFFLDYDTKTIGTLLGQNLSICIPMKWCALTHWAINNVELLSVTFVKNVETRELNYRFNMDSKFLMETNSFVDYRNYIAVDIFNYILSESETEMRTFVLSAHPFHQRGDIIYHLSDLDPLKYGLYGHFRHMKPLVSDGSVIDKIFTHLEELKTTNTATLKESWNDNSKFINGFEYFSIPLYYYDTWNRIELEPYKALVFDDDDNPVEKELSQVTFSEPNKIWDAKSFSISYSNPFHNPPKINVQLTDPFSH